MMTYRNSPTRAMLIAVVTTVLIAGCASKPPTIDMSEGAEVSFDGLHKVKNARADDAWARPGIDISQYSKILLQGAGVEYRPGGESGRSWSARSAGGPFEVTALQKERLRAILIEEFVEELERSEHFELVNEPGPDVLLVRGALLDVVSFVPPDPVGGRSDVYLSRIGEATLVIELRDSITETILARAVDRRAAEPMGGMGLQQSNRVMNAAELRRLANYWARSLRERLDEFGEPAE